jgi:hypothetical protein
MMLFFLLLFSNIYSLPFTINLISIRSKVKLTYHTYAHDSIGLPNLYLVPQNIQPQLISGQLVVSLQSFF